MQDSVSLSVTEREADYIAALYSNISLPCPTPHIRFFASGPTLTISIYKKIDKEGNVRVVFQGIDAKAEASKFSKEQMAKPMVPLFPKKKATRTQFFPQIGSDEVGTGDFFGPVVVCAALVCQNDKEKLKELGVTDSKKMDDSLIMAIGPDLSLSYPHSLLILRNQKYNEVIQSGLNMNSVKAKMHNQCLLNLSKKYPKAKLYQDQFAPSDLYYRYLSNEKEVATNITFETKGESKYPSVALASVIARYAFLSEINKMSQALGRQIPLGAGPVVDRFAEELVRENGIDTLGSLAKLNFANYKRLYSQDLR